MVRKEGTPKTVIIFLAANTVLLLFAIGFLISINMHLGAGGAVGLTGNAVKEQGADTGTANPSANLAVQYMDDDAVKGDKNAPVTIVEWSDFQCPFCARFYNGAYQDIKKEYIDTGKVKFVYRDFPVSIYSFFMS